MGDYFYLFFLYQEEFYIIDFKSFQQRKPISTLWWNLKSLETPGKGIQSGLLWHLKCLQPSDTQFSTFPFWDSDDISPISQDFGHSKSLQTSDTKLCFGTLCAFQISKTSRYALYLGFGDIFHFLKFLQLFTFWGFYNILENVHLGPKRHT